PQDPTEEGARRRLGAGRARSTLPQVQYASLIQLVSLTEWQLPAALSAGPGDGGVVNLPAVIVIALASVLLVRRVRQSARATAAMAVLKLAILVAFCAIGFTAFKHGHLTPFSPAGLGGIGAGTTAAFFSYIGFDAITTAGEEAKNPRRDIPVAILVCL